MFWKNIGSSFITNEPFLNIAFSMMWWVGHHRPLADSSTGLLLLLLLLSMKPCWVSCQLTSVPVSVLILGVISYALRGDAFFFILLLLSDLGKTAFPCCAPLAGGALRKKVK